MHNIGNCDRCKRPLIEIDHYGERLIGCIECNRWQGGKRAFVVELSVEDIEALRGLEVYGRQARSIRRRYMGGNRSRLDSILGWLRPTPRGREKGR